LRTIAASAVCRSWVFFACRPQACGDLGAAFIGAVSALAFGCGQRFSEQRSASHASIFHQYCLQTIVWKTNIKCRQYNGCWRKTLAPLRFWRE
jgi:hypothetical protein